MLDRFAWLVEGLVVRPERMRANLEATGGLFFSQRLLLALVQSGLSRTTHTGRAATRDAGLGRGARLSQPCGRPRARGRVDLAEVFDLGAYTRHVDVVFERRRAPVPEGRVGVSSRATHLASGKVRELYALDDDTLLLAASDRISTFDVVLRTPIPDKGRVLTGLSAFWFARTSALVPNHLLELGADGRSMTCRRLEMLPVEFVVRGYLAGLGWKDYRETGAVCGHALPAGLEESARLPEPIVTPATKAPEGHDENIDEERAATLCGERRYAEARAAALELYRSGRNTPNRVESSSRTRSSSSASRRTARSSSVTRR